MSEETPRSTLTQIGGWKLGKTLGRGAYAHVRLATHPNGHKAACKILPALHRTPGRPVTWDETIDAVEAHKEVVLLKALSGAGIPGIAGLEGVMEEGGWTYVFLTLYPASASAYPTPWNREHFIIFFRRLLITINDLHQLNVSHEDLKRSNVLVDRQGLPAVVDFGFSHFKSDGGHVRSAGGTLDYSSPEKVADIRYDHKANDVWALGILALKLLGIAHPYTRNGPEENSTKVKERIIQGRERFRFHKSDTYPGGIAELLMGMLERDPGKRWNIPKILRHSFLQTRYPDPPSFTVPPCDLSFMHKIDPSVIDDLCFLAYLNHEFFLCETPKRIIDRLHGKEPCWEKRWASILGVWSNRAEMDWEDIPATITPLRTRSEPTIRSGKTRITGRALREIHLTPANIETHMRPRKVQGSDAKQQKENKPPKQPRKSRIYGMKGRDGSSRTISGEIDPQLLNEEEKTTQNDAHRGMKKPKPGKSIAGGNTKDKMQPGKAKDKTANKHGFVIYNSESETSAKPSSSAATTANPLSSATSSFQAATLPLSSLAPGSSTENAIVVDSSSSPEERKWKPGKMLNQGKAAKRVKGHGTVVVTRQKATDNSNKLSHPGKQLNGLHLASNPPKVNRRRSPRLQNGEQVTSAA